MKKKSWKVLTFVFALCSIGACNDQGGGSSAGKEKSPPPQILHAQTLEEGYKICLIGDAGSANSAQYKVSKALEQEGCARILYAGDVIYERGIRNADDKEFIKRFYDPYKNLLENKVPFYMAMGNHDYDGSELAWVTLSKRYEGKIIFPSFYYAEIAGDVCFLMLDTNRVTEEEQSDWVKQTLQIFSQEGCQLTLAVGHHPYWSVGEHGDAEYDERVFLEESILGKVSAYLAGHDHILSDETTYQNTRLIVSGAGGQDLYDVVHSRPGGFARSVSGYVTIEIDRSGSQVQGLYKFVQVNSDSSTTIIHTGSIQ